MDEDLTLALDKLYSETADEVDWLRLRISLSGVELPPAQMRGLYLLLDNEITLWRQDGSARLPKEKYGLYKYDTPHRMRGPLGKYLESGVDSWEQLLTELGEWADGL